MIEKVARALATKHGPQALISYDAGSISTDYWNSMAKAAIEAMVEATNPRSVGQGDYGVE